MSKKVLVSLDMNKNEIQNVVMQSLATAPTSPKEGQYYYNSVDKKAYQWNGSAWKPLGGTEITVDTALSDSSTNPVQNKAVKAALDGKANANDTISSITEERDSQTVTIMGFRADGLEQASALVEKATQSYAGAMSAADKTKLDGIASGANKTVVDTSVTQNGNNPVTGKAIYDYVGDAIAASDAMIFKGTIGTGGTVTVLPTTYKTGWTYRVITAGTYAGQDCEVGDLIIALVDRDGTGNLDSDWTVAQTNIDGAITDIKGTTPILVDGSGTSRTISHADSPVTPGQYGETSNKTLTFGGTFSMPYVGANKTGHFTGGTGQVTITLPNNVATEAVNGLMSASDKDKLNGMPTICQDWFTLSAGSTTAKKALFPIPSKIISVQATAISTSQSLNHHTPVVVDWEYVEDDGDLTVSIASAYSNDIEVVVLYSK